MIGLVDGILLRCIYLGEGFSSELCDLSLVISIIDCGNAGNVGTCVTVVGMIVGIVGVDICGIFRCFELSTLLSDRWGGESLPVFIFIFLIFWLTNRCFRCLPIEGVFSIPSLDLENRIHIHQIKKGPHSRS